MYGVHGVDTMFLLCHFDLIQILKRHKINFVWDTSILNVIHRYFTANITSCPESFVRDRIRLKDVR